MASYDSAFFRGAGRRPPWRRKVGFSTVGRTCGRTGVASLRCQGPFCTGPSALRSGDGAHGVVKAHPQHLDEKVDGVAGQCALGPAPVALFEEQAWMTGQLKVAGFPFEELQAAPLQKWNERGEAGGADLVTSPARAGGPR